MFVQLNTAYLLNEVCYFAIPYDGNMLKAEKFYFDLLISDNYDGCIFDWKLMHNNKFIILMIIFVIPILKL